MCSFIFVTTFYTKLYNPPNFLLQSLPNFACLLIFKKKKKNPCENLKQFIQIPFTLIALKLQYNFSLLDINKNFLS